MSKQYSVGIICAYFGQLPGCYQTWLHSCEYNRTVDFFLVTDQHTKNTPTNVHVINMSFQELKNIVVSKFGESISLEQPYKLCDFKPMYGVIFQKYLNGFDYWGHCDMDLVFGDLQHFFEYYHLEKFDKFLNLGHLSLYRNTEENNYRFEMDGSDCGSWKKVLADREGYAFDEVDGIYQIYLKHGYPQFDKRIFADISCIYKRFRCAKKDINYENQIFYWENGHVYRDYWEKGKKHTEEFIYIHFKQRRFEIPKFNVKNVNAFFIVPSGFIEKHHSSTLNDVFQLNCYKGQIYEKMELNRYRRKQLFSKVQRGYKTMLKGRRMA